MPDIVIKAENLGKKYVIGHQAERGDYTLSLYVLMQNARTLCGNRGTWCRIVSPYSRGEAHHTGRYASNTG
jgi:hypothetical protein